MKKATACALMVLSTPLSQLAACTPPPHNDESDSIVESAEGWRKGPPRRNGILVYRNQDRLELLDTSNNHIGTVSTTSTHMGFGTPTWSEDGKFLFDFELQVIAISAVSGSVETLSSYPVQAEWPEAYPQQSRPRYVHDASNHRLIYVEMPLRNTGEAKLVSIDLVSHERSVLISHFEGACRGWAVDVKKNRLYLSAENRLETWSLSGERLSSTVMPGACASIAVSPQSTLIAVSKRIDVDHTDRVDRDKGCWIVDETDMAIVEDIPFGQEFVWSHDGKSLAFLRRSEEVWIYHAELATKDMIAKVRLREGTPDSLRNQFYSAPAWSSDDALLACTLSRPRDERRGDYVTLLIDVGDRMVHAVPGYRQYLSWSPVARPFGSSCVWSKSK